MNSELIDWTALGRLRSTFLKGAAGQADYWQEPGDLEAYDATFAQRIGWKWDHVLGQLRRLGWTPPAGEWLDWGCGSGIAGRACLGEFGRFEGQVLRLHDRSAMAVEFATRRVAERHPGLAVAPGEGSATGLLMLSHVLGELAPAQVEELLERVVGAAQAVIWVEPGTRETGQAMAALRDRLRETFRVVAPCSHQEGCGLRRPGNEAHWCHHFASPPPAVFTDGDWARFARITGIDLRSLPVSYLVLDRRPAPPLPAGVVRVLGRPRVYKGHALILGCEAGGVFEGRLTGSAQPGVFRKLKKGQFDSLGRWELSGNEIATLGPWPPGGPA